MELDTDRLRETIDEEVERAGGGRLLRWISLTTGILAALAAIASLRAGATVNEALVLKTEATRLQAQASDQWAYYQAKGIKSAIAQSEMNSWKALGKRPPSVLPSEAARYSSEQDTIRKAALRLEHERDQRAAEADVLLEQHHRFGLQLLSFRSPSHSARLPP